MRFSGFGTLIIFCCIWFVYAKQKLLKLLGRYYVDSKSVMPAFIYQ